MRELADALAGADLIYVALPVGLTIELLPEIARARRAGCAGHRCRQHQARGLRGGRRTVFAAARAFWAAIRWRARKSPGSTRPMPNLFRGAKYALIRRSAERESWRCSATRASRNFVRADRGHRAREPMWLDARSARPRRGGGFAPAAAARRGAGGRGPRGRPTKRACR